MLNLRPTSRSLAGSQAESLSPGVVAGTQVSTGHCAAIPDAGHYLITDHRSCHLAVARSCQNISAGDLSAWLQYTFRKQTRPANLRAYRELTRALPIGGRLNGQPTLRSSGCWRLARPPRASQTANANQVIAKATRPEQSRTRPVTATARKLPEANSSRMVHLLFSAHARMKTPAPCTVKRISGCRFSFAATDDFRQHPGSYQD